MNYYYAMIINKWKMVKALRIFDDQDYIVRKKAIFLYYFILAALFVAVVSLISTSVFALLRDGKLRIYTFITIVSLIVIFAYALLVLTKGKFSLSANILVLGSLIGIWTIIFLAC